MRKLKAVLADDNVYTFTTLTLKEQNVAKNLEDLPKDEKEQLDKLLAKEDEEGKELTDKEQKIVADLQDKQMRNMLKIVVMSLAKKHDEFKITNKNTEEDILDKTEDLLDVRDMRRFTTFAILGTLPVDDDDEIETEEIIDLTVGMDE